MKKTIKTGMLLLLCMISCNKDVIDNFDLIKEAQSIDKIVVHKGILSFSSKDFLGRTIECMKHKNDQEKREALYPYYDQGFMPLYPYFEEDDTNRLSLFAKRKKIKVQKTMLRSNQLPNMISEIDQEDDLISDDEFAALLNDEREIIVNDTLYRYTYSGLLSVHKNKKQLLDDYIHKNKFDRPIPNPKDLVRGHIKVSSEITQSLPANDLIFERNDLQSGYKNNPFSIMSDEHFNQEDYLIGSGYSVNHSLKTVNHTDNLLDLIDNLDPCNTLNGFLNSGFGLFGVSRKCYDYFSSKYRTKTKYWKENYIIWNSIGVKVKHQKKGWTGLWRAKRTDEVALAISQASFKFNINIPRFPQHYAPQKLYFFENKIFNNQSQLISYFNQSQRPPLPEIPFVSEVVVTEYISTNFGYDLSVEKMRELFYQGVWQVAKTIVTSYKNRLPKNVTHIVYTPTTVYLNYVDLQRRKLKSKKIVNRLDYNFGLGFKFNVNVDSQGHFTTDLTGVGDVLGNIVIPKLYDYKDATFDFVGASRKGSVWKGSRIVYTD